MGFLSRIFVPLDYNLSDTNQNFKISINKIDLNNIILINNQCVVEFTINKNDLMRTQKINPIVSGCKI